MVPIDGHSKGAGDPLKRSGVIDEKRSIRSNEVRLFSTIEMLRIAQFILDVIELAYANARPEKAMPAEELQPIDAAIPTEQISSDPRVSSRIPSHRLVAV
jgi:predicted metalloenzyme YecM